MRDAGQSILAVGFFDGVHLGHRAILSGATRVLTFRNHPLSVLCPDRAPRLVMSLDARLEAIRACGIAEIDALDFTPELAATSPEAFLPRFAGCSVRCGENWRFGAGGAGDADFLRAHGVPVTVVGYVAYRGERISSSRIRTALARGEIEDANAMLGDAYRVVGEIFAGKGEGRRLGFPTVNLRLPADGARLPYGVYAVETAGRRAIANYGVAPTFGDAAWPRPVLEVHFTDTPSAEIPPIAAGTRLEVSFSRFIRPERTFATVADLRAQIAADCAAVGTGGPAGT